MRTPPCCRSRRAPRSTTFARRCQRSASPAGRRDRGRAGGRARADRRPLDPLGPSRGAEIVTVGVSGSVQTPAGNGAAACRRLADRRSALGRRLRDAERAVVIWSGPAAGAARTSPASPARSASPSGRAAAPSTCHPRRTRAASRRRGPPRTTATSEPGAAPPARRLRRRRGRRPQRTRARRARRQGARLRHVPARARVWADVVIPATSYLERDGTTMNLEGRLQRQRRAVIPPATDETAWSRSWAGASASRLPARRSCSSSNCRNASTAAWRSTTSARRPLPARTPPVAPDAAPARRGADGRRGRGLRLVGYRPLFSGPAVDRVDELGFQRPGRRSRWRRGTRPRAASRPETRSGPHERDVGRAARTRGARARARPRPGRRRALPRPGPLRGGRAGGARR